MRGRPATRTVWMLPLAPLFVGGLALRLGYIAEHFDLDWEPDAYQHVLLAKFAVSHGATRLWTVIDVWAKPLYTAVAALLFALLPHGWPGLVIVQSMSCLTWLVAVGLIADVARRELGPWPAALAAAIGLFGNVAFRSSVSALTEPIGALTVAAALWFFSRRRFAASFLCIGLAPLARLDAVALVAVQLVFFASTQLRGLQHQGPSTGSGAAPVGRRLLVAATLSLGPLVVWNFLGAVHSGYLLFLGGQYPVDSRAIYGTGGWLYYPKELWRFDPVMLACAVTALAAALRGTGTARLAGVQGALHLALLAAFWKYGRFGSAGLLRYFMLVQPCLLLVAAWAFSALSARSPRAATVRAVVFTAVAVGLLIGLVPLYRPPQNIHNQLTSLEPSTLGSFPYRELEALRAEWPPSAIHSDRPEALYYLGAEHGMYDEGGLASARDADVPGLFVYSPGWTDAVSGTTPKQWPGMRLIETLPPGIAVYRRP